MPLHNDSPLFKAYVKALRRALAPHAVYEPTAEVVSIYRRPVLPRADAMSTATKAEADLLEKRRA